MTDKRIIAFTHDNNHYEIEFLPAENRAYVKVDGKYLDTGSPSFPWCEATVTDASFDNWEHALVGLREHLDQGIKRVGALVEGRAS